MTGICAAEAAVRRAPDAGHYVLTDPVASGPAMFDTAGLDRAGSIEGSDPDPIAELGRRAVAVGLLVRCPTQPHPPRRGLPDQLTPPQPKTSPPVVEPPTSPYPTTLWPWSQNTPSVRPNGGPMMDYPGLTQVE
jgi:hypothetical protein